MSKQTFKKLTAVLLTAILLVSSLPMTVFAAELQQNGDVYSVNMPASGSDTLDLTDKTDGFTFKVYDDGGSDESYSNYCDGTLLITAPEGFLLKISGSLDGGDYTLTVDKDGLLSGFDMPNNKLTMKFSELKTAEITAEQATAAETETTEVTTAASTTVTTAE